MITGEQNDSFEDLKVNIVNFDAISTYVFRPTSKFETDNPYLFEGDRCGFSRRSGTNASDTPVSWFGADSPTMGSLSPNGVQATFFQYFNTTAILVSPKTQPRKISVQHIWRFVSNDKAVASIFAWYPSNDAFNDNTSIGGYQGTAVFKKVADFLTCVETANATKADPSTLPLLDYECNTVNS